MHWKEFRKKTIENYENEKKKGKVDADIIPLLDLINTFECFVTLSSCSGRIYLIDIPKFGEKEKCKILAKWHDLASADKILKIAKLGKKQVWLIMQPPILHIACKSLEHAKKLLQFAMQSGFSNSGIISLKKNVVRLHSNERIEVLIALNSKLLVSEEYLKILVELANQKLVHAKGKIKRLMKKMEKFMG